MFSKNRLNLMPFLIIMVAIILTVFLVNKYFPSENSWFFYLIPLIAFCVNLLCYKIVKQSNKISNFSTIIFSLFGLKFFSYLTLAVVFFVIEKIKAQRLIFVSLLFATYIANIVALLLLTLKFFKTISNQHSNSD